MKETTNEVLAKIDILTRLRGLPLWVLKMFERFALELKAKQETQKEQTK